MLLISQTDRIGVDGGEPGRERGRAEDDALQVVARVRAEKNDNIGFNALTETFEDLVAAGVIDPAKVTRTALQNASSIAGLLLTTEAMISEISDDNASLMPAGSGGLGY